MTANHCQQNIFRIATCIFFQNNLELRQSDKRWGNEGFNSKICVYILKDKNVQNCHIGPY